MVLKNGKDILKRVATSWKSALLLLFCSVHARACTHTHTHKHMQQHTQQHNAHTVLLKIPILVLFFEFFPSVDI